ENPVRIAEEGVARAREEGCDTVLIDTAGRLHIDEAMMEELRSIREAVQPQEILLVVDAMTGQDAVNVAEQLHNQLGLTGVVLSRLAGEARGGAVLSVKAVPECPFTCVGTGEKTEAREPVYPDRMASRILGMGDVLTLVDKAQAAVDEERAKGLERKMRT